MILLSFPLLLTSIFTIPIPAIGVEESFAKQRFLSIFEIAENFFCDGHICDVAPESKHQVVLVDTAWKTVSVDLSRTWLDLPPIFDFL